MTFEVVIAGAGPNGLMPDCALALAGVRPLVLVLLPERSTEPKANGLVGEVARLPGHRGLHDGHAHGRRPRRCGSTAGDGGSGGPARFGAGPTGQQAPSSAQTPHWPLAVGTSFSVHHLAWYLWPAYETLLPLV